MNEDRAGSIVGVLPAGPEVSAQVVAPAGTETAGIPPAGVVVGWVLVADPDAVGGARLDPAFLAAGRAWTPDQYQAAYGQQLDVQVKRAI
ncbi:hypothetical protein [Streptomyces sp. NPDC056105]|uniref:hypothetical protein n=1 Tax=Streptomyces sp. NPDC056105 TaxID=3345714 RepID=UPI0035D97B35